MWLLEVNTNLITHSQKTTEMNKRPLVEIILVFIIWTRKWKILFMQGEKWSSFYLWVLWTFLSCDLENPLCSVGKIKQTMFMCVIIQILGDLVGFGWMCRQIQTWSNHFPSSDVVSNWSFPATVELEVILAMWKSNEQERFMDAIIIPLLNAVIVLLIAISKSFVHTLNWLLPFITWCQQRVKTLLVLKHRS